MARKFAERWETATAKLARGDVWDEIDSWLTMVWENVLIEEKDVCELCFLISFSRHPGGILNNFEIQNSDYPDLDIAISMKIHFLLFFLQSTSSLSRPLTNAIIAEREGRFRESLALLNEAEDIATDASLVAYINVRQAHLHHDALGSPSTSLQYYNKAINDPHPSSLSFHGKANILDQSEHSRHQAIATYRLALLYHTTPLLLFHLAISLERVGVYERSQHILNSLPVELSTTWNYCRRFVEPSDNLFRGTRAMIQLGVENSNPKGIFCEFGVSSGRSMRMLAEILPTSPLYGFDTFTGLPEAWLGEDVGTYTTEGVIPSFPSNVACVKGLFSETVPQFLAMNAGPLSFANIDCDLYSSTMTILTLLQDQKRIVPGSILLFDEFFINEKWADDEFGAFHECVKKYQWRFEFLAISLSSKQACIKML